MRMLIVTLLIVAAALPAAATEWCGCNGNIHLSFSGGPQIEQVAEMAPGQQGLTIVSVYAILDDVTAVEGPGGVFLALGGFELDLRITGAKPATVAKNILIPHHDFGSRSTQCRVGASEGQKIVGGPLALCQWIVTFTGDVADVRFDLDPAGMPTCDGIPGCNEAGASGVYVGTIDSRQEGMLMGTGCVPAMLNPSGEPNLEPVPCAQGVDAVGLFHTR